MTSTSQTADLAGVLAAAFDEFEELRLAARGQEDRDRDLFPAFFMAGTAAADGRDALITAPAFPPGPAPAQAAAPAPAADPDPASAAGVIAARAAVLAAALDQAGAAAAGPDREACREAAAAARRVSELLRAAGARDPG